jgi:hypothetical protein
MPSHEPEPNTASRAAIPRPCYTEFVQSIHTLCGTAWVVMLQAVRSFFRRCSFVRGVVPSSPVRRRLAAMAPGLAGRFRRSALDRRLRLQTLTRCGQGSSRCRGSCPRAASGRPSASVPPFAHVASSRYLISPPRAGTTSANAPHNPSLQRTPPCRASHCRCRLGFTMSLRPTRITGVAVELKQRYAALRGR